MILEARYDIRSIDPFDFMLMEYIVLYGSYWWFVMAWYQRIQVRRNRVLNKIVILTPPQKQVEHPNHEPERIDD